MELVDQSTVIISSEFMRMKKDCTCPEGLGLGHTKHGHHFNVPLMG